jgi:transposase-like protein
VEYHHDRETRNHEQEATQFQCPVQVGDGAGWAAGEKTVAQICRERDITESLYYKWRDAFMERATDIFADQRGPQRDEQAERIAELERLAGKQALEIEILKKAGSLLGSMREQNGR